jgi:hypothetical protein
VSSLSANQLLDRLHHGEAAQLELFEVLHAALNFELFEEQEK